VENLRSPLAPYIAKQGSAPIGDIARDTSRHDTVKLAALTFITGMLQLRNFAISDARGIPGTEPQDGDVVILGHRSRPLHTVSSWITPTHDHNPSHTVHGTVEATSQRRFLIKELIVAQFIKKFPAYYET
jgi:hypothetical protein